MKTMSESSATAPIINKEKNEKKKEELSTKRQQIIKQTELIGYAFI